MKNFIDKKKAALWVIDVQEKLFPFCYNYPEVLKKMILALKGMQLFQVPCFVTEQYPQGLGSTFTLIKDHLSPEQKIFSKTTFSGYADPNIKARVDEIKANQWVLIGIETHICVLQTAKDLLVAGKEVVILNDATTSRATFDFSTAIGEMRDMGVRITNTETILYELLRDANKNEFKPLLNLVKNAPV